jgi:hypothetical protein
MIGWDNIVRSVDLQNIFRIQNICTTCYKDWCFDPLWRKWRWNGIYF